MPSQVLRFPDGNMVMTDIDRRYCSREVPMKVLALGLCRTGTMSLTKALKNLGYSHTYHANDAIFSNARDCELWMQALRAKFDGKGKPWGRKEFDQLLGHCQAVTDIPAICFADELIQAYPEAKVIITTRDVDAWQKSASSTINALVSSPFFPLFNLIDGILRTRVRMVRPTFAKAWNELFEGSFEANGRRIFFEHQKKIASLVPPENLLIYQLKDGWEPLCKFLDQPIPLSPMPHENEMKIMQQKFQKALLYNVREYWIQIFYLLSSGSFFFLMLSLICGDDIIGPHLQSLFGSLVDQWKLVVSAMFSP